MATAESALRFNLFAKDQTGPGIKSADSNFSKLGKGLVTKFAAAAGAIGAVSLFKGFIDEARESEKVTRLTENVIKSTGKAAKVSADQVGALATQLSNKTAVDDEVIQSGQNLLLTFTGIRNEVGKGNNIFDQASKAALDMAAGLNGGTVTAENLKGTSVQLGKALNDPIKGITALSRSGVSFTDAQKKTIKSMVETGDTMGAQKVILAELNKEFGGAAAAAADPAQKAQVAWGNLQEQLGTQLLPLFNKIANFAADKLIPAIATGAEKIGPIFKSAGKAISVFTGALSGESGPGEFDGWLNKINRAGIAVGGWIRNDFLPAARQFGAWFKNEALPALQRFAQAFWRDLQPAIKSAVTTFQTQLRPAIEKMIAKFQEAWPTIQRVLKILGEIAGFILSRVVPVLIQFYGKYLATVIRVFAELFAAGWKVIGFLIDLGVKVGQAGAAFGRFVGKVATAIGDFKKTVSDGIGKVVGFFKDLPGNIVKGIGDVGGKLVQKGKDFIAGFGRGVEEQAKKLPFGMGKVVGWAIDGLQAAQKSHSPAKVTIPLGEDFVDGYAKGISDNAKKPGEAAQAMVDAVRARIDEAKQFGEQIRDTFRRIGDLSSIDTTLTDAEGNQSEGGLKALLAGLKKQADDASKFAATIKRLRKAGLNEASLGNLREAGPEGGLQAAQQLLAGGTAAVAQVNALMKQLNQTGQVFANRESRAMFGFDASGKALKGGQQVVHLSFDGASDELTNAIVKSLRTKVRVGGGSVQVVLGQGGR